MRTIALAAAWCCFLAPALDAQVLKFQPNTTLHEQTSNNSSASDRFRGLNGNAASGNVSKVPTRELLYPGANTRIYAHFMPWFGNSNHMDVGYRSDNAAQVRRQVADMVSRGMDGAIIDWYGPGFKLENDTTLLFMREAERYRNFQFAIMEDLGALRRCAATPGCNVTTRMIEDLNYAYRTYYGSPAYLRVGGRPVVFFFGVDLYRHDWARVRREAQGNPLFIFRQHTAFRRAHSDGAFAWTGHGRNPQDMALEYWDEFYEEALRHPQQQAFGSGSPGFDNRMAAWVSNPPKITDRQCGLRWLETFARAGRYYSAHKQLPFLQIITWNDYEEGSAIESGIDNCVKVEASIAGTRLTWSISGGSQRTIHHFVIYVSRDGQQLMALTELPANRRTLDLAAFSLEQGSYRVRVQAVGQPSIKNQMSSSVGYSAPAPSLAPIPEVESFLLAATPPHASVRRGQSADFTIDVRPNQQHKGEVELACGGLPLNMRCSFAPGRVTPNGKPVSTTLTVHTEAPATASLAPAAPLYAAFLGLPALLLAGAGVGRRRRVALLLAGLLAVLALGQSGCGGSPESLSRLLPAGTGTPVGSYSIVITGSSGPASSSTSAQITVRE